MNTHHKTRLRVTAAITAAIGSLALAATTSATTTPAGHSIVRGIHVREQHTDMGRHVRSNNQAPCRQVDSDCTLAAALTNRNTVGGRITYR